MSCWARWACLAACGAPCRACHWSWRRYRGPPGLPRPPSWGLASPCLPSTGGGILRLQRPAQSCLSCPHAPCDVVAAVAAAAAAAVAVAAAAAAAALPRLLLLPPLAATLSAAWLSSAPCCFCRCCSCCSLLPYELKWGGAALLNISLLASDLWTALARFFFFGAPARPPGCPRRLASLQQLACRCWQMRGAYGRAWPAVGACWQLSMERLGNLSNPEMPC